jgi:hypothetical protein
MKMTFQANEGAAPTQSAEAAALTKAVPTPAPEYTMASGETSQGVPASQDSFDDASTEDWGSLLADEVEKDDSLDAPLETTQQTTEEPQLSSTQLETAPQPSSPDVQQQEPSTSGKSFEDALSQMQNLAQQLQQPTIEQQQRTEQEQQWYEQQQRQTQRQQLRDIFVSDLTKKYQMTEAQAQDFNQNPVEALPQLAAQIVADSVDMAMAAMQGLMSQHLPQYITQVTEQTQVSRANEDMFFTSWPELKDTQFRNTIASAVQQYRQRFPEAPKEKLIADVGPIVWLQAGLPVENLVAKLSKLEAAQQSAAPAGQIVHQAPAVFAPAMPGSRGPQPTIPGQTTGNEFTDMAEDILRFE